MNLFVYVMRDLCWLECTSLFQDMLKWRDYLITGKWLNVKNKNDFVNTPPKNKQTKSKQTNEKQTHKPHKKQQDLNTITVTVKKQNKKQNKQKHMLPLTLPILIVSA